MMRVSLIIIFPPCLAVTRVNDAGPCPARGVSFAGGHLTGAYGPQVLKPTATSLRCAMKKLR